jgi:hypothetical protein
MYAGAPLAFGALRRRLPVDSPGGVSATIG